MTFGGNQWWTIDRTWPNQEPESAQNMVADMDDNALIGHIRKSVPSLMALYRFGSQAREPLVRTATLTSPCSRVTRFPTYAALKSPRSWPPNSIAMSILWIYAPRQQ